MKLPIPLDFAPMEAHVAKTLPESGAYQFEPKWDGFRALCFRDGDEVEIQSKSGQPLARYFPEIVAQARALEARRFVLDGELVVPVGDGLDFDQLLQRIHPAASRVAKLAAEFPATYLLFDLLVDARGEPLVERTLAQRRPALEAFAERYVREGSRFRLSPMTGDLETARDWYAAVGGAMDGIVAKRTDLPYASGNRTAMLKIKRMRTADCVVGGYRPSKDGGSIGALLLGLYDESGGFDYVGFTSGLSAAEKQKLLPKLRALEGESAFTVRSPGGPSRWNRGRESEWIALRPELVIEIEYDHVSNGRFRHGTRPLRFRPDKSPRQCTTEQLATTR